MEHGSIITQARREDALVLTKQGRGQQLPKTLRRPRSGRGLTPPRNRGLAPDLPRLRTGDSTRDPRSFRPGVRVRTPTPVGVARAPSCGRRGGGASSAQLSLRPAPPPREETGGPRRQHASPACVSSELGVGRHFPARLCTLP